MSLSQVDSQNAHAFSAYVCTEPGAALAREVIGASGAPSGSLMGGGLSGAARAAGGLVGGQMLLTELGELPVDAACENVSELRKRGAEVIVFGQDQNINTYRALRKAGALEYFHMPVTAQDILSTEIIPSDPANLSRPVTTHHRTIGVISTNGGVGASALAASLGHLLASGNDGASRTALIDADLQFGTIALDLDRLGTPGLLDALRAPDRIDGTFLQATMDQVTETLSIYSHSSDLQNDAAEVQSGWLAMLERAKMEFATTVVDLPRSLIMQDPKVLHALDAAILVVPAGYAGVSAAVRLVAYIRSVTPDTQLSLALSEVRKDAQLSCKDIAQALRLELSTVLPRCDTQVLRAQRKGKTVAELYPRAPYAKACQEILSSIAPDRGSKTSRKGLFRKVAK